MRIRVELAFDSSEKPQHGLTRQCEAFRNLIRESTNLPCCSIHCNMRHVESYQACAVLSQKLNEMGPSGKTNLVQASPGKTSASA